jgi:hypothetical protein
MMRGLLGRIGAGARRAGAAVGGAIRRLFGRGGGAPAAGAPRAGRGGGRSG